MNNSDERIAEKGILEMLFRCILCLIFPPLAVFDKGCGVVSLALLLTFLGWLPGMIFAFFICFKNTDSRDKTKE